MGMNGFLLYNIPNEIRQAAQQNNVGPDQMENFRQDVTRVGYLLYGGPALLGLLFFIFGLIIKSFPVPITITSLVLYIGATAVFGLLNPMSLAQGFIMKAIFVVALFRAIKAARAFENDRRDATALGGLPA